MKSKQEIVKLLEEMDSESEEEIKKNTNFAYWAGRRSAILELFVYITSTPKEEAWREDYKNLHLCAADKNA